MRKEFKKKIGYFSSEGVYSIYSQFDQNTTQITKQGEAKIILDKRTNPIETVYSCWFPEIEKRTKDFNEHFELEFMRNNITHKLDDLAKPLFDKLKKE